MRLLLRAGSHRPLPDGSVEIAASPDTPRREPWQWDLRLVDASGDIASGDIAGPDTGAEDPAGRTTAGAVRVQVPLDRSDGTTSTLALTVHREALAPRTESVDVARPIDIDRDDRELLALVVGRGIALVEGRHLLGELDALIIEGDDPASVRVEQASEESVSLALIRLQPTGPGTVGWVP